MAIKQHEKQNPCAHSVQSHTITTSQFKSTLRRALNALAQVLFHVIVTTYSERSYRVDRSPEWRAINWVDEYFWLQSSPWVECVRYNNGAADLSGEERLPAAFRATFRKIMLLPRLPSPWKQKRIKNNFLDLQQTVVKRFWAILML